MRKSLERLNRGYEIDQINVVFDFLGGYSKQLECHIKRLCEGEKEAKLVIEQCQKWVLSQNCEILPVQDYCRAEGAHDNTVTQLLGTLGVQRYEND